MAGGFEAADHALFAVERGQVAHVAGIGGAIECKHRYLGVVVKEAGVMLDGHDLTDLMVDLEHLDDGKLYGVVAYAIDAWAIEKQFDLKRAVAVNRIEQDLLCES